MTSTQKKIKNPRQMQILRYLVPKIVFPTAGRVPLEQSNIGIVASKEAKHIAPFEEEQLSMCSERNENLALQYVQLMNTFPVLGKHELS